MSPREQAMVPEVAFESYYGRQILKTPTWKTPDVPLYLFLGGLAGASSVLAEGAALTGRPDLERVARLAAAGGAAAGTVALVHDLGRPERFLHMLRVFKPTSPLSVGSFILAPFSGLSAAAAASLLSGRLPRLGRLAGVGAAAFGPPLATYTAALISNTAVPAWHEARRELPFVFAASSAAAAGGAATLVTPVDSARVARRLAVAGGLAEVAATMVMERRLGELGAPYRHGRPAWLMRGAKVCAVAGAGLVGTGGRRRGLAAAGGVLLVAGSALERWAIFRAGVASAKDPRYTVAPQRRRRDARARQAAAPA